MLGHGVENAADSIHGDEEYLYVVELPTRNPFEEPAEWTVNVSDHSTFPRWDGAEQTVPVEDLEIRDVTFVRPGEKIPDDSIVVEGASAVNQAPITGKSLPANKTTGDEVYAGTINEEGYLEVEVTAGVSESTLARIIELVELGES